MCACVCMWVYNDKQLETWVVGDEAEKAGRGPVMEEFGRDAEGVWLLRVKGNK